MKRFTKLQRILLIGNIVLLVFGLTMMGLRQNPLSNMGYSAWTYIKYGLIDYPLTSIGNAFSDLANLWHVYEDNQYLNEELSQQRSYKTLYEEERNRNAELEELLEMKGALKDAKNVSATVLSRDVSGWDQTVTISAGSKQEIEPNMIVCTSKGAVGLIEEVQTATSTVRLLTSDDLYAHPRNASLFINKLSSGIIRQDFSAFHHTDLPIYSFINSGNFDLLVVFFDCDRISCFI